MRTIIWALAVFGCAALALLSGLIKVQLLEPVWVDEAAVLSGAGFADWMLLSLGGLQILGGLLVVLRSTRRAGAMLSNLTFVAFTTALFLNGFEMYALGSGAIVLVGLIPMLFSTPPEKPAPAANPFDVPSLPLRA